MRRIAAIAGTARHDATTVGVHDHVMRCLLQDGDVIAQRDDIVHGTGQDAVERTQRIAHIAVAAALDHIVR